MSKKILCIILIVIIVIAAGIVCLVVNKNKNANINEGTSVEDTPVVADNTQKDIRDEEKNDVKNKSLVVYFSVTNNTEKVANNIADVTKSDIVKIVPEQEYTSEDIDYNVNSSRANREQNDSNARPKILNEINVDGYDTIYIGFPVWWNDVPKIILTFLDNHNFNGKTIIPFCTSGSSSITSAQNTIKNHIKNVDVKDGKRFSSSVTREEISNWINN